MTTTGALLAFAVAASVLTITPGLDTALVLRSAVTGGPRSGAFAAVGIGLGCLLWGGAVSIGLAALLSASQLAYTAVKWAGAAYLLRMGSKLIIHPRKRLYTRSNGSDDVSAAACLRQGLLTNLLNPKIGVFYITFLPQFVPTGVNVAAFSFVLATIHVLLGLFWFTILISATVPMGRVLRRPLLVTMMDRVSGGIFLGFGAKLALSR